MVKPSRSPQVISYAPDPEVKALRTILARARDDVRFLAKPTKSSQEALKDYDLNPEVKAAILGGDVR